MSPALADDEPAAAVDHGECADPDIVTDLRLADDPRDAELKRFAGRWCSSWKSSARDMERVWHTAFHPSAASAPVRMCG